MSWLLWVVVAWIIIGIIATVAVIGRPRGPMTPELATGIIIINMIIAGLIIAGGHLS